MFRDFKSGGYNLESTLAYNSIVAFDLGCETAITTYNGKDVEQISNPRFTQKTENCYKTCFQGTGV